MEKIGVIHGRFQPPHTDHLKYLLAARSRCEFLVIGVSNPDPELTRADEADPERARPASNPLSYYERLILIRRALVDEGVDPRSFCVVPFPINYPDRLRHYVPMDSVFYMTIYDEWGEKKLKLFEGLEVRVEVMWRRKEKGITGSEVREAIRGGEDWEGLVPPGVADLMKEMGLDARIREMGAG